MSSRHTSILRVALFVFSALTSIAQAAEGKLFGAPQSAGGTHVSTAMGLTQVTLALILVLAAVFAAAWLTRKMRNASSPAAGSLKVLGGVSVGGKERVVLVQVHDQQILVGVASGSVNVVHVFPSGTPTVTAVTTTTPDATARPDFKALLKRSLGMR
jgi:flagellar protein FliO/FliZ